ncbi:MAG: hypothetical protein QW400_01655 [Candidatus Diapherotrites archaeon]
MQLPIKIIKLAVLGIAAFLLTLLVLLNFLSSSQQQEQTKQIASTEKVDVFDVSIVIENGGFSQSKLDLAKNSLSRIAIFNKDFNKTHQIVLISPYADGSNSLIERRSLRPGSVEKFMILNKPTSSVKPQTKKPLDMFLISCLTCAKNTTLTITSLK